MVPRKKYPRVRHQHTAVNTGYWQIIYQMPVGADVFEVKRRNACPVCVWGTPKPIRGHYFRGREEYVGTQRKEKTTMSRDFLRKLLIKLNTDKKRGI